MSTTRLPVRPAALDAGRDGETEVAVDRKSPTGLGAVVDALTEAPEGCRGIIQPGRNGRQLLPSRDVVVAQVEALRAILFPGWFSEWDLTEESLRYYVGATLDRVLHVMQEQVERGLCVTCDTHGQGTDSCAERARDLTQRFLARLPEVRRILWTDVEAAFEGDPATDSVAEIIFAYPGLRAITYYRLAHELHVLGVPLIPRMITEYAHSTTGIDIHPGARIGERFFIDHGTGVVIGATAIVGDRVRLYQGVTLGAKSFPLDANGRPIKGVDRHPILEDDVVIYAGATILGRITIGRGSVVGGNVWLTRTVPPGTSVTQSQARQTHFDNGGGI